MTETPIVQVDFRVMQGDGWARSFVCYSAQPLTAYYLSGYVGGFSLRQNYGDASALLTFTSSTPSANGSNITVSGNSSLVTVRGADTLALPIFAGQRQTRFFYDTWVTPLGGDPVTLAAGAWYLWSRV